MENPLISVILPCYNVGKFVGKCIKSIQKQTFQNYEIICIDDCSTDKTLKVLENIAKIDKRIRIISHSINKGAAQARNTGVINSHGEYIAFIDPDDYINCDYLERLIEAAKNKNAELVITTGCTNFCGFYKKVSKFESKEIELINTYKYEEISDNLMKNFFGIHCFPAPVWGKLYKKTLFKDLPKVNVFYQDDVLMNFYVFTKNLKTLTAIDYNGYNYRYGGGTSFREGYLIDNLEVYQIRRDYLLNSTLDIELKKLYLKYLLIELKNIFYEYVIRQIIHKVPKNEIEINLKTILSNPSVLDDIQDLSQKYELNLSSQGFNAIFDKNVDLIISLSKKRFPFKRKFLNFLTVINK